MAPRYNIQHITPTQFDNTTKQWLFSTTSTEKQTISIPHSSNNPSDPSFPNHPDKFKIHITIHKHGIISDSQLIYADSYMTEQSVIIVGIDNKPYLQLSLITE